MQALQHCVALVLALWLASPGVRADVPLFRVLGAAQGLPSERVHALAQDGHGCLWVGTADGLARFDGNRFEVFHHDPLRADSLPANNVQSLHSDARGRLWVGFEGGGLAEVRDHGRRIARWRGPEDSDLDADVWTIASDLDGALYFGGFGSGVVRIDPDSGARERWGNAEGLLSDHVLALAGDPAGGLWVASLGGLQRLHDGRIEAPSADSAPPPPGPVFSLTPGHDSLLVGTREAAYRYRSGRFHKVEGLASGPALGLVEDAEGAVWIGRPAGLELLPQDGEARAALSRQQLSGRRSVMDLLRDHEDGLWVASDGGGLLHLPPRWRRFRGWPSGEGGLATAGPTAVAFDAEGRIWSGGGDGRVERIEASSGAVVAVVENDTSWPDRRVTGLLVHAGTLWIGTMRGLVLHPLEAGAGVRRVLPADSASPDAPPLGPIDQLVPADDGSVWLSSYGGGVERRDAGGRLLQRFTGAEGLAGLDTEQLRLGPDGVPWVAGADGVQRLDPTTQRFTSLPALAGERVFGFAFAADGRLWAARRSGLVWLHERDGEWALGARLPLLSGIEVGGLASDAAGRLWASSARGLWRIDPERGSARRFGVRDGLPGQEFSDRPLAESLDRRRFAAVLPLALMQIDSELFDSAPMSPRLRLEPVTLQREGGVLSLAAESGISLRHDDREIGFAARVASFIEPDAWRFRIRLEPFDAAWVELGSHGQRILPRLDPGRYRLQVQAAGPEGGWHPHPPLDFEVTPPWWQHTAARVLQALLALALLALALAAHRRRGEARAAAALAESERRWALQASAQKSQFLATLAHEIRTPMTGMLGMAELLARSRLDPTQQHQLEAVRRSGDLLMRLVDDALDLARIEAGTLEIRPRPCSPRELGGQAVEAMRARAEARGLELRLQVDEGVPPTVEADPERLLQILLNLIGNAIKFTDAGSVVLDLRADDRANLVFEVRDSGRGIPEAQRQRLLQRFQQAEGEDTARRHGGAGLGLAICSELAAAMGGRLQIGDAPEGGACIRVELPLPVCAPPAAAPAMASGPGLDLLLVEDDALVAEALLGLLAALGHRPRHAGHALDAIVALEQAPVDAALLDLDLPGMDGLQLAGLLRSRRPQLPLLALTARSHPDTEAAVRAAGFAVLLRKPLDLRALDAGLRRVLRAPADAGREPGS